MTWHTTHRGRLWWQVGTMVAIVVLGATVLLIRGLSTPHGSLGTPPPDTNTTTSTTTTTLPVSGKPTLAVKIDNVRAARPATGLGGADVVYVEPVEGGLTRLIAVYQGEPPAVIGPVRSARQADIEVLGQYGKPVLAYSGAAPELLPTLRAANVVNASPTEAPGAYYRDAGRPAPHNLYLRPQRMPGGAVPAVQPVLQFGPAPLPGGAAGRVDIAFRAATFGFSWSPDSGRWLVSMDGTPMTSTESGRLGAATVIEQRVEVSTVGQGKATILRDGQEFDATWTRPDISAPTRFHTASGAPLPLAPGPVWILLVPA